MKKKHIIILIGALGLAIVLACLVFAQVIVSNGGVKKISKSRTFSYQSIPPSFLRDMASRVYRVDKVLDGDTIEVSETDSDDNKASIGKPVVVRLLGIDTPETVDPRKPPQCYGEEASDETKRLLNPDEHGRVNFVRLETDPKKGLTEKYGRLLAYVRRDSDSLFLNKYLIEKGYAREYTYQGPYRFQQDFRDLEKQAKAQSLGLWNTKTCPTK